MTPGYYPGLQAAEYHAGPGVSKSQLDLVARAPALLLWARRAPQVQSEALDFGTAFHTLVLEPDRFAVDYVIAPDVDRRTKDGRAAWEDFQASIADGAATAITADDHRRLHLMRDSLMAHPVARALLTAAGDAEASIYYTDAETGELCRCRPDKIAAAQQVMVDLKTIDDADRFDREALAYRYHVAHAHYVAGAAEQLGGQWDYLFVAVGKSTDAGRYPVRVIQLDPGAVAAGQEERRRNLDAYAAARRSDRWPGVEIVSLPPWSKR